MNTIKNVLQVVISCSLFVLAGCMSMEEMLASSDPDFHAWGEAMAVDEITAAHSDLSPEKKLELLAQIKDQERLAKIYVHKRTSPEIKSAAAKRISEESAYQHILAYAQNKEDVQMAISGIKSDAGRLAAASTLLRQPNAERKKIADSVMADLHDEKLLGQYLQNKARSLWEDKDRKQRSQRWYSEDEAILNWEKQSWVAMLDYVLTRSVLDMVNPYHTDTVGRDKTRFVSELALDRDVEKRDNILRQRDDAIKAKERDRLAKIEAEKAAQLAVEREKLAKIRAIEFKRCLKNLRPKESAVLALKKKTSALKDETLVMKGFYIGMPIEDAQVLIWSFAGEIDEQKYMSEHANGKTSKSDSGKNEGNVTNEVMMALGGIICKTPQGMTLTGSGVSADQNGKVILIGFSRNDVDRIFDVKGVSGKLFCEQLVDSYPGIGALDYSSVQVEDVAAKQKYERRAVWNAFMSEDASMAFSAGLNMPEFKKWVDCYHCESKKGWQLKIMAEAKGDETFMILEQIKKVSRKNFD